MKKKTIRAGIAGAGYAAGFHCAAMKRVYCAEVELVGVYSTGGPRRAAFAEKEGIQAYDSLDALLEQVDVLHICTPSHTHEVLTISALQRDVFAIVEKPLTGFFGDGSETFRGDTYPKQRALTAAQASIDRIVAAEKKSKGRVLYAENWVYAPAIQKEREILEKTEAQILWMHGEESHSGSHSPSYGFWKYAGGGSMMSKGCHPLTAALYLKQVEGRVRHQKPIRPASVSAHTHALTRSHHFKDDGLIRADYHDIEDFSSMHVVFEDGTVADIIASDIVLGGVHNWLEVNTTNHRTLCHINPNTSMQTFNPVEGNFRDIEVIEKIETKQGWACTSPDEDWFTGYQQEIEAFYGTVAEGLPIESNLSLAADCIRTIYCGYVSADEEGKRVVIA